MLVFIDTHLPIIGTHLTFGDSSILKTVKCAARLNMRCFQIFMGGNIGFARSKITDDICELRSLVSKIRMNVFTHLPYVFNLAGSKEELAWNGNEIVDEKLTRILNSIRYETSVIAEICNDLDLNYGCVLHPGNHKDKKLGIQAISQSIDKIDFVEGSYLLLENSSGSGTSIGSTLEELADIYHNSKNKKYLGICLDTCHLYSAGCYDLSKIDEIDRLFTDFICLFGSINVLKVVHLNDSKTKRGSTIDRHEIPCKGMIWNNDIDSYHYLVRICKDNKIPMIIECDPHSSYEHYEHFYLK